MTEKTVQTFELFGTVQKTTMAIFTYHTVVLTALIQEKSMDTFHFPVHPQYTKGA